MFSSSISPHFIPLCQPARGCFWHHPEPACTSLATTVICYAGTPRHSYHQEQADRRPFGGPAWPQRSSNHCGHGLCARAPGESVPASHSVHACIAQCAYACIAQCIYACITQCACCCCSIATRLGRGAAWFHACGMQSTMLCPTLMHIHPFFMSFLSF